MELIDPEAHVAARAAVECHPPPRIRECDVRFAARPSGRVAAKLRLKELQIIPFYKV